jgi:hypothetical protein
MGREFLVNRKQVAVREGEEHSLCMCMAQGLRTLLSQNDARTNASADVRMTGFRSLTARPRNPPVPLATNIASESLAGIAFQRAAEALQYAVPAPVASSMYGNVTNIFAAQHPHSTRFALTHTRWYVTDGSMIQSSLKELETMQAPRAFAWIPHHFWGRYLHPSRAGDRQPNLAAR